MEAFFSDFTLFSKNKKKGPSSKFCNFSPRFLRHTRARRREPRLSKVFGGKQKRRFLAGEKTPEFAKFQCENVGKNFALFCAYREHWREEQATIYTRCVWKVTSLGLQMFYFIWHVNFTTCHLQSNLLGLECTFPISYAMIPHTPGRTPLGSVRALLSRLF